MTATIVILAAGLGNRFGGPKQLVPVGPSGESILSYNSFDAVRAGFERVVVVTRPELEDQVSEVLSQSVGAKADVAIARQRIPEGRTKPYGTAEAVVAAAPFLDDAFAVANSDDLYGPGSFESLTAHLRRDPSTAGIVGFVLADTVPAAGAVSRGLLACDGENVRHVMEVHRIQRTDAGWEPAHLDPFGTITGGELVSMNLLALPLWVVEDLRAAVDAFVASGDQGEVYLPEEVASLLARGKLRARLLRTDEVWAGMTNPEDIDLVRRHARERWPSPLWS